MNITIDGKNIEAIEGETILAVASRAGIEIPTLCHQKELAPFGSCFICVVEIEGMSRLVPSCATPVANQMNVQTNSARVRDARKTCMELLLSDHVGDCRGPCQVKCPAGIDIPGFISLLAHNKVKDALILIKETMPFPASLGRVCPRPCETQCKRACSEDAVSICFLKRYIADRDIEEHSPYVPKVKPFSGKRVAIIGAGPGGLTAAFYLRKEGHAVDVFDDHEEAGGMLRYGIPAYRLPREILSAEIGVIQKMGVNIKCGMRLGRDITIEALTKEYDAVFVAIGAQKASSMQVKGEEQGGAIAGIEFLEEVAKGRSVALGERVVVVGGGNTAIDAARTALRLGSKSVTILYRRTRSEMPANIVEIEAAQHEGVKFEFLSAPVKMARERDGIDLTCIKMALGEPDASGRRRPVPTEGSEHIVSATSVISAIGQSVDPECLDAESADIRLTKWRTLDVNPDTFETSAKGVFAGGDCASGADIAVTAIAAGRKAAISIDQYLRGEKVTGEPRSYLQEMAKSPKDEPADIKKIVEEHPTERTQMQELAVAERIKNFEEVELGFSAEDARKEAERCLSCGCRSFESCKLRKYAAEYGANPDKFSGAKRRFHVDESHPEIRYESHKCIMCGSCVRVCSEVKNLDALGFVARGFFATVKPILERPWNLSTCDSCMKCVPLCPTGAISLKVTPADEVLLKREKNEDASKAVNR